MICPKCQQPIKDSAYPLHQLLCKGTAGATGASTPVAKPAATPAPAVIPVVIPPAVSTGTGAQSITPTDTRTVVENTPAPAPFVIPQVGTPEYKEYWAKLTDEQQQAELVRRGLPPKDTGQPPAQPQLQSQNGSEIFYPVADPYFMVTQFIVDALEVTHKISRKNPTNLLITGQPGGGKTSLALQFAAKFKRPAVVADFGVLQEPQQLFQTTHLVEQNGHVVTETRESAFIHGIETEDCTVIIDEMNRVENERCLNPLMPLLDGRGSTWIDELHRRIHVAKGVVFIATINEGSMFAGISSLDAALRDRFREVYMDYPRAQQESEIIQNKTGVSKLIANSLAEFAYVVRTTPLISRKISTRQMLHAAEAYACGATLYQAVETAIGNYNDLDWRQQVMEIFSINIKDPEEYKKWTNKPRTDSYVKYQ